VLGPKAFTSAKRIETPTKLPSPKTVIIALTV
jgi:hypothetical protein